MYDIEPLSICTFVQWEDNSLFLIISPRYCLSVMFIIAHLCHTYWDTIDFSIKHPNILLIYKCYVGMLYSNLHFLALHLGKTLNLWAKHSYCLWFSGIFCSNANILALHRDDIESLSKAPIYCLWFSGIFCSNANILALHRDDIESLSKTPILPMIFWDILFKCKHSCIA